MEELILRDFFFERERRRILEFKALKNDRFLIVFSVFLRRKKLMTKLLWSNSIIKNKGLKYRLISLKYDKKETKYEVLFECTPYFCEKSSCEICEL